MSRADAPIVEVSLAPDDVEDEEAWRKAAARALKVPPKRIAGLRLRKKSIDARRRPVRFRLRLEVGVDLSGT